MPYQYPRFYPVPHSQSPARQLRARSLEILAAGMDDMQNDRPSAAAEFVLVLCDALIRCENDDAISDFTLDIMELVAESLPISDEEFRAYDEAARRAVSWLDAIRDSALEDEDLFESEQGVSC